MQLCKPVLAIAFLAVSAFAEITPTQRAAWADLKEYHKDIATFEALAARAMKEAIPDGLINVARFMFYIHHGEIAPLRLLITQLEKSREDVLGQRLEVTTAAEFDRALKIGRDLLAASEKDPAKAAAVLAKAGRFAQAQTHLKDLRLIDSAIDQYTIEHNKRDGDPVPEAAWKQYVPKNQRLWRTGADCLGNPYGPQVVNRPPKLSRANFESIAESVPKEYFTPFGVAEK